MIDLHCHLLPGLDDGPKDMAQSLAIARLAVDDGIERAVVTPHILPGRWDNEKAIIEDTAAQFRKALLDAGIPLEIHCAAEVRVSDLIFPLLEKEKIPFLGRDGEYDVMLIEFPANYIIPGTESLVGWLVKNGIRPVIAHPERNREMAGQPDKLRRFLDMGCLAQLTAASIVGRFGSNTQTVSEYFISENMIDLVASDTHNTSTRAPRMTEARRRVTDLVGATKAAELFDERPAAIAGHRF